MGEPTGGIHVAGSTVRSRRTNAKASPRASVPGIDVPQPKLPLEVRHHLLEVPLGALWRAMEGSVAHVGWQVRRCCERCNPYT